MGQKSFQSGKPRFDTVAPAAIHDILYYLMIFNNFSISCLQASPDPSTHPSGYLRTLPQATMPVANPVEYTYVAPKNTNTGSTQKSIPYPPTVSRVEHIIAGIKTLTYGLAELPASCTEVAVVWLLHPRLQAQECMAPFAAQFIHAWNALPGQENRRKGLIAVSFDQRNHGTRLLDPVANEAWRSGNERHAQDMFSSFHGTAVDTSQLLDHIASYIFPDRDDPHITENIVLGISLGGHGAWHVIMQDPRFTTAVIIIGCPDYARIMTDRARLSKRSTYTDTKPPGSTFLGSVDFPTGLVDAVARFDPAGRIFGKLLEISPDRSSRPEEKMFSDLTAKEIDALRPIIEQAFYGKRIINLSGGADKLVPYAMGKPFLDWLKGVTGPGGPYEDSGLVFEDIIIDGAEHEVPPSMVEHMQRFLIETLKGSEQKGSKAGPGSGRRRESQL